MIAVVPTTVVILMILTVEISYGENEESLPCDKLPTVKIPDLQLFIENSPFQYDYALLPMSNCGTKVFTNAARGATNYNGTAVSVIGSSALTYDYTVSGDRKSVEVTLCGTGEKSVWYSSALDFDDVKGAFICLYLCNKSALFEFKCFSNNNGTSPKELDAVKMARRVPNGDLIHDTRTNCTAHTGCSVF